MNTKGSIGTCDLSRTQHMSYIHTRLIGRDTFNGHKALWCASRVSDFIGEIVTIANSIVWDAGDLSRTQPCFPIPNLLILNLLILTVMDINDQIDEVKRILNTRGIEMNIYGCGCCGSPTVSFKCDGKQLVYRVDDFSFEMFKPVKESLNNNI